MLLSYSRGSLLALAVGCALWFAAVPLRLRGAAVLGVERARRRARGPMGVLAARPERGPRRPDRALGRGHGARPAAGRARRRPAGRRACRSASRRHAARPAAGPGDGSARASWSCSRSYPSCSWSSWRSPSAAWAARCPRAGATSPTPTPGRRRTTAGRLTAVGSVRARYWREALKVFEANPGIGVGAGGYADRAQALPPRHARGSPRPRLRRPDAGRPRPRRRRGSASRCSPPSSRPRRGRRPCGRAPARGLRRTPPERDRPADAAGDRRDLRRALARRLDLVRARDGDPSAAVRRLARRPRTGGRALGPPPRRRATPPRRRRAVGRPRPGRRRGLADLAAAALRPRPARRR